MSSLAPSIALEGLVFCFKKNLDYGVKLVADLSQDQMALQPVEGLDPAANHPAWVLSHLNVYLPIMENMIKGEAFPDPKQHRFGMLSKPETDSSIYASKEALVDAWVKGHEHVIKLLSDSDESVLSKPVMLERWKPIMATAGLALPYLMLNHENCHLGQLSAWRRVLGLPSV